MGEADVGGTVKFNIREITESDLPEIFRWFNDRKWPMPAVEGVGPTLGFLAEKEGVPFACIYSYVTGTSVAYLEWPGTNPDIPQDQAMQAFDEIIMHFKKMCELSNPKVRVLCLTTQNEALSERFKKHGFKIQKDNYRAVWTLKE